ncbi:hypothetical protein LSH36_54g07000 [Paralvinella palmiformis]|uniref:Uncharacterized protein n=1 Tax=Paralvinella palmiformis TaxID=53620 RepID=A0AAD9K572_9ANNE|nr:hypothetical protein LSH36_54g07000 [Paralvinella palmiformis]
MQRDLTTRDHQSPAINVCWKWYAPRGVCYAARLYGSLRTRGENLGSSQNKADHSESTSGCSVNTSNSDFIHQSAKLTPKDSVRHYEHKGRPHSVRDVPQAPDILNCSTPFRMVQHHVDKSVWNRQNKNDRNKSRVDKMSKNFNFCNQPQIITTGGRDQNTCDITPNCTTEIVGISV